MLRAARDGAPWALTMIMMSVSAGGLVGCGSVQDREPAVAICPADENGPATPLNGLEEALDVLGAPERISCWPAALEVLGSSDDPRALNALTAFIQQVGGRLNSPSDRRNTKDAFQAVRLMVRRLAENRRASSSQRDLGERALNWLLESTSPVQWERRKLVMSSDTLQRQQVLGFLTGTAVEMLVGVEHNRARLHLSQLALAGVDQRDTSQRLDTLARYYAERRGEEVGRKGDREVLGALVHLHPMPPGRITHALLGVPVPAPDVCPEMGLTDQIRYLRIEARDAWQKERDWRQARRVVPLDVQGADEVADRRLAGLDQRLQSFFWLWSSPSKGTRGDLEMQSVSCSLPEGASDTVKAARAVQVAFFGCRREAPNENDLGPSTRATERLAPASSLTELHPREQVDLVLERIAVIAEQHGEALKTLGLEEAVSQVADAHRDLAASIQQQPQREDLDAVLARRADLQLKVRRLLASTLACFHEGTPDQIERRGAVLSPLLLESAEVEAYLLRRRAVKDKDPDTGHEVEAIEGPLRRVEARAVGQATSRGGQR